MTVSVQLFPLGLSGLESVGLAVIPARRLGDSRDSRIGSGVIQDSKRRVFAMGQAVPVRTDYTAGEVRRFAKRAKDAAQARRLLAIAAVVDGGLREERGELGGVERPAVRGLGVPVQKARAGRCLNNPCPRA